MRMAQVVESNPWQVPSFHRIPEGRRKIRWRQRSAVMHAANEIMTVISLARNVAQSLLLFTKAP